MNDAEFQELMEASWRRRLTPEEEDQLRSWLAIHPERQAHWEAESHLNRALAALPHAPVASNFTALVLQEARRSGRQAEPRRWWRQAAAWLSPRPATGMAWAALLLCVTCVTWFALRQAQSQAREQRAQDLAILVSAALLPEPQMLAADFDAIRRLPPVDDEELFAVLQETANP